jgi:hypothetical protein
MKIKLVIHQQMVYNPSCNRYLFSDVQVYVQLTSPKRCIPVQACTNQCFRPMRIRIQLFTSMRIRIRDLGSQTNADPCGSGSGSDKTVDFDMKYTVCFMYVICHKTYQCHVGTKAILKGWKSGLFVNFGQFSLLLDPDSHSQ